MRSSSATKRDQTLIPSRKKPTDHIPALARQIIKQISLLPNTSVKTVRAVRRQVTKQISSSSAESVVTLALALLHSQSSTLRWFAYELILFHPAALRSLNEETLQSLGAGLDNWVAVDTFACYLAGPAWRERQVSDRLIRDWSQSTDRWWRRAALVCTVPLNSKARGGAGDISRTLKVCKALLADRDDMVVKAMSWALRELGKRHPAAVRAFIEDHEDKLAPRVIREVRNKLQTGLKNPKKKTALEKKN
ncbi:MAG TPA: DNA alkylation repair protein [Pyrinomonadaceae bacterium]|jgi:3-methyladenine DNA glycosylase AlkD|nr:DNA alkylation repair protein [Pyrinomonadaceae bacterium]